MSAGMPQEDWGRLFDPGVADELPQDEAHAVFNPEWLRARETIDLIDLAVQCGRGLAVDQRQLLVNELATREIDDWNDESRMLDWFVSLLHQADPQVRLSALPSIDPKRVGAPLRRRFGSIVPVLATDADPAVRTAVIDRVLAPFASAAFFGDVPDVDSGFWPSITELEAILEHLVVFEYTEVIERAKIGVAIETFLDLLTDRGRLDGIVAAFAEHDVHHDVIAAHSNRWLEHLQLTTTRALLTRFDANQDPDFHDVWAYDLASVRAQCGALAVRNAALTGTPDDTVDALPHEDPQAKAEWYVSNLESGKDASGACLRGADLAGRKLIGCNFTGADLTNADLRGAQLNGALFYRATLVGALLDQADLSNAMLSRADLRDASLFAVDAGSASCVGTDLRGANLTAARFRNVNFGDADLRGTSTDGLDVYGARLAGSIRDPGFPDGC